VVDDRYEVAAREVLRLVTFFEKVFSEDHLYCTAVIPCEGGFYSWHGSRRGFEFTDKVSGTSRSIRNVHDMEIAAGLVYRIEEMYSAALEEQSRVANVLEEAAEVGRLFAEKQLGDEDVGTRTDAIDEGSTRAH